MMEHAIGYISSIVCAKFTHFWEMKNRNEMFFCLWIDLAVSGLMHALCQTVVSPFAYALKVPTSESHSHDHQMYQPPVWGWSLGRWDSGGTTRLQAGGPLWAGGWKRQSRTRRPCPRASGWTWTSPGPAWNWSHGPSGWHQTGTGNKQEIHGEVLPSYNMQGSYFHELRPEYSVKTRLIPQLLFKINRFLSSMKKDFNYLQHLKCRKNDWKYKIFSCFLKTIQHKKV